MVKSVSDMLNTAILD